jgi:hypothetical protein
MNDTSQDLIRKVTSIAYGADQVCRNGLILVTSLFYSAQPSLKAALE